MLNLSFNLLPGKVFLVRLIENLKATYPGAQAWSFGDSPEMADELSGLVIRGIKTASCGSLDSLQVDEMAPEISSHAIILNGQGVPVWRTSGFFHSSRFLL